METWLYLTAGAVVFFGIVAYVLFMIFLPEWVGITGQVALDAEKCHQGGDIGENEFWVSLDQVPVERQPLRDALPSPEKRKG